MMLLLFVSLMLSSSFGKMVGGSAHGNTVTVDALGASAANSARDYYLWKYLEPEVMGPLENITVAQLQANPSLVYEWAKKQNWDVLDHRLSFFEGWPHIQIIGEVAEGTIYGLPKYKDDLFDPNIVGADVYLAYQYRATRAIVNRYKSRIHIWQLENELNEAYFASLEGRRHLKLGTSLWMDWNFCTSVLSMLRNAVKDEDASAKVLTNVNANLPAWNYEALNAQGYYIDAIKSWVHLLDYIGIDAEPNSLTATPCGSAVMVNHTKAALEAGGGLPVIFMEWNYPLSSNASGLVDGLDQFTSARQVSCIHETIEAVFEAGALGVHYFSFDQQPGIGVPPGGYTAEDQAAIDVLRRIQSPTPDPALLKSWLTDPTHVKYVKERLPALEAALTSGNGLVDMNGAYYPGFYALRDQFEHWASQS